MERDAGDMADEARDQAAAQEGSQEWDQERPLPRVVDGYRDGGPAFPRPPVYIDESMGSPILPQDDGYEGMTLRDYFAGQALVGILASPSGVRRRAIVAAAWDFADVMVAEKGHRERVERQSREGINADE